MPFSWMERWQVPLYVLALACGALLGYVTPQAAHLYEAAINPSLMLLLYATFLAVPFAQIRESFRDLRFMAGVVALNFAIVPVIVFALVRVFGIQGPTLVGVLLVLLAPCIDYVIVFTRLAGGNSGKLLAVTPLLMLLQLAFLPLYLFLFTGGDVIARIDWVPFVQAFFLLILLPLALSVATHKAAERYSAAGRLVRGMDALMIPLMMLTLMVVVASQIRTVADNASSLLRVALLYAVFLMIMPPLGIMAGRLLGQDVATRRALAFTCATRNSLVVLPLALALPAEFRVAGIVVVTQTLVELMGMVTMVALLPRLVRDA